MELLNSELSDKDGYELLRVEMEKAAKDYTEKISTLQSKLAGRLLTYLEWDAITMELSFHVII